MLKKLLLNFSLVVVLLTIQDNDTNDVSGVMVCAVDSIQRLILLGTIDDWFLSVAKVLMF